MSRIDRVFSNKKAYVAFITAGDGGYTHSLNSALTLIKNGVDILEIGVPFSDPVADGETIQEASQRAIKEGMTLDRVLELTTEIRQQSETPLVLFSYYNPIFLAGKSFYAKAKQAGIDGILVVDLPLEESLEHNAACQTHHIQPIFLISQSTSNKRIEKINQVAQGMLYYVCRNGTTGIKSALPENFAEQLQRIKQHTTLPIITGFGISNKAMATQALKHAEGFVVGSLFVKHIAEKKTEADLAKLVQSIDPR